MRPAPERREQIRMVRDSIAAVAPPDGDLRRVRALRFTEPGFDREVWATICAMGWPGMLVPEESGGTGFGLSETCALAEGFGAALLPEPLLPAIMAARLLSGEALAGQLSGERLILPAWQEAPGALLPGEETRLAGDRVSGRKSFIPMAAGADAFLVVMPDSIALVPAKAPGVSLALEQTQDGGHYGILTLAEAPAERLPTTREAIAAALDEAALGNAAMLLGLLERAFQLTLDYLRTRKQFGRPIGAFQALQHRAADLKVQAALTRASVEDAAATLDAGAGPAERQAAISRAKARAASAALHVTREAIQMHGGIGYTDEADIGLYLRRAMVLMNQHGSAAAHRRRYADVAPQEAA